MAKYKALKNFNSESQGLISEGDVLDITVGQAIAINEFTQEHLGEDYLERVEEPKKTGRK